MPEARGVLVRMADGDGPGALTLAEEAWRAAKPARHFRRGVAGVLATPGSDLRQVTGWPLNLISALHKSVRGSDRTRRSTIWPGCSDARGGPTLHRAEGCTDGGRGYRHVPTPGPTLQMSFLRAIHGGPATACTTNAKLRA